MRLETLVQAQAQAQAQGRFKVIWRQRLGSLRSYLTLQQSGDLGVLGRILLPGQVAHVPVRLRRLHEQLR